MAQPIQNEQLIKSRIFREPSETLLCAAGRNELETYLKTGKAKHGFAVLSNQTIYCKGPCYVSRDRRRFRKQETDFPISLDLFQGMKNLQKKSPVLLTLAFLFLLLGPVILLLDKLTDFGASMVLNPTLDGILCVLLACVFFLIYSIEKRDLLELIHANGSIGLDTRYLPEKEKNLLVRYLKAYLNSQGEQTR